jgi:hypothetical protein
MSKYRITFSYNYTDVEYSWDGDASIDVMHTYYRDEIIVDEKFTVKELLELQKRKSLEDFGDEDAYTDIQIEKIDK